jgi:3-hydroxyacyl-[acyl-carrier-protein] dehydratase
MTLLDQALRALPHGPEFRFIDRLVRLEPGISGAAEFMVREDAPFLRGHFPGCPLFPGVLLIEAAAQLIGTVAQSAPDRPPLPDLRLTALQRVKILGTAHPGETIFLEATVTGRLGSLIQGAATISINGQPVLEASVTLSAFGEPSGQNRPSDP